MPGDIVQVMKGKDTGKARHFLLFGSFGFLAAGL